MLEPFIVDKINFLFEVVGAIVCWRNTYALWKDKEIKGVYWPSWVFYSIWGLWTLYFYAALSQPWSLVAGIVLTSGHIAWVIIALYITYVRK